MPICRTCNEEKGVNAFPKSASRKDCKACTQTKAKERMKQRKEEAHTITKVCTKCGESKVGTEFPGLRNVCRPCFSEAHKEANNRPSEDDPPKVCHVCETELPATEFRSKEATCKKCNTKKLYEWRKNNKEQFLKLCKNYRDKETSKEKRAEYLRNKYNNDLIFKLESIYRKRIRECIKKKYFPKSTKFDYGSTLGCPWEIVIGWLEFNMDDNMNWDNHGTYWHIDHVLPVSSFDFSREVDRQRCFNWTNLMPLEGIENIKKSNTIQHELVSHARKRAIEFLQSNKDCIVAILTDPLPDEIRYLVESGVLTTKGDVKASAGSGEISEVW
jgi:hypothetical protein